MPEQQAAPYTAMAAVARVTAAGGGACTEQRCLERVEMFSAEGSPDDSFPFLFDS